MNVHDNFEQPRIKDILLGRRLVPHQEIFIISPYLSAQIFSFVSKFSFSLRVFLKNGASVTLITRPQPFNISSAVNKWKELGLKILYNENLHAKIYYFLVDKNSPRFNREYHQSVALVGSANFTKSGTGMESSTNPLEEVCILLKEENLAPLKRKIEKIQNNSIDSSVGSLIINKLIRRETKHEYD